MAKPQKGSCTVSDEIYHTGFHLLLGFAGASRLAFVKQTEKAIAAAVRAIKATLQRVHPHYFLPQKAITGRAILFDVFTNNALGGRYFKIPLPHHTINLERER